MLIHDFMRNALLAGTSIAAACGAIGYLMVLRGQVFAADALSHVAFTGALAAVAFGIDIRIGLFVSTIAVAIALGFGGSRAARADDVLIGSTFAWVLGLGVLFLSIFATRSGSNASGGGAAIRVLFGSIFGLSHTDVIVAVLVSTGVLIAAITMARPLLFATLDPRVAMARGVPVTLLGIAFLALVGIESAEAAQAVGALLLLGLLAAPAGAAWKLTANPWHGLALSIAIAIGSTWGGLALAAFVPRVPPSFSIVALAAAAFAIAGLLPKPARAHVTTTG